MSIFEGSKADVLDPRYHAKDSIQFESTTTVLRDAKSIQNPGDVVYNTDTSELNVFNGTIWETVGSESSLPANAIPFSDGTALADDVANLFYVNARNSGVFGGILNIITSTADNNAIIGGAEGDIFGGAVNCVIAGTFDSDIGGTANSCVILGGNTSSIPNSAQHSAIVGAQLSVLRNGVASCFIGGGFQNEITEFTSRGAILGGQTNTISGTSPDSVIIAGINSTADDASDCCLIGKNISVISLGGVTALNTSAAILAPTVSDAIYMKSVNGVGINTNTPLGGLTVNAALNLQYTTMTNTGTIPADSTLVGVRNSTGGGITINIPSADVTVGRIMGIKDELGNAGTNSITISTIGSANIDGSGSCLLNANFEMCVFYSDGTNWFILSRYGP